MADEEINCVDCNTPFTIGDGERDFFIKKGFSLPKRCKPCRIKRKQTEYQKKLYTL